MTAPEQLGSPAGLRPVDRACCTYTDAAGLGAGRSPARCLDLFGPWAGPAERA